MWSCVWVMAGRGTLGIKLTLEQTHSVITDTSPVTLQLRKHGKGFQKFFIQGIIILTYYYKGACCNAVYCIRLNIITFKSKCRGKKNNCKSLINNTVHFLKNKYCTAILFIFFKLKTGFWNDSKESIHQSSRPFILPPPERHARDSVWLCVMTTHLRPFLATWRYVTQVSVMAAGRHITKTSCKMKAWCTISELLLF